MKGRSVMSSRFNGSDGMVCILDGEKQGKLVFRLISWGSFIARRVGFALHEGGLASNNLREKNLPFHGSEYWKNTTVVCFARSVQRVQQRGDHNGEICLVI